jgi:osmotically-inducible protein OsmY
LAVASPILVDDEADQAAAETDVPANTDTIREIQNWLKELGYYTGPADGRKGPRLRMALRDYQTAEGLPVTGSLDAATYERILQARAVTTVDAADTESAAESEQLPSEPVASEELAARAELDAVDVSSMEPASDSDLGAASATAASSAASPPPEASAPSATETSSSDEDGWAGAGRAVAKPPLKAGEAAVAAAETTVDSGRKAGEVVGEAGETTAKAAVSAGKLAAEGGKTTGEAAAQAGTTIGRAGKKVGDAAGSLGELTVDASVGLVKSTKRLFTGNEHGDADIRQNIERQFANDDRIAAAEFDVRVSDGRVTLAVPHETQSDVDHAVQIARLTAGVKSVMVVRTAPPIEATPPETKVQAEPSSSLAGYSNDQP